MMDYQAAYVTLREGILSALEGPDDLVREGLNEALNRASTPPDDPQSHALALQFVELAADGASSDAVDQQWRVSVCELVSAGWRVQPPAD